MQFWTHDLNSDYLVVLVCTVGFHLPSMSPMKNMGSLRPISWQQRHDLDSVILKTCINLILYLSNWCEFISWNEWLYQFWVMNLNNQNLILPFSRACLWNQLLFTMKHPLFTSYEISIFFMHLAIKNDNYTIGWAF